MTTTLPEFYSFEGANIPLDRTHYLGAVLVTAGAVLARAADLLGPPTQKIDWYGELIDFVNEVYLGDDEAVRLVLGVSPNLLKIRPADVKDAVESAASEPGEENFTKGFFGQTAYRVFERDLWDAVGKVFVERYGADLWDAMLNE